MTHAAKQIETQDTEESLDFSVAMHVGFGGENHGRYMKLATCIALYLVLFILWMPGFQLSPKVYKAHQEETRVERRKVLRPPPEKPLVQTQTRNRKARKVPMPDLSPLEPEPQIAATAIDVPQPTLTADDWEIGIPDAPPRRQSIAIAGTPGVDPPVFTKRVPPEYPQQGVAIRLQGYVILQAILRKDGSVDAIEVLRGLGRGKFGFERAAIASLRKWEFVPGSVDGQPADVRMNLRVDFILN